MLLYLVPARDAKVDLPLANERGDIGRGEEQESDGEVLDKGDVEAVLALELDLGTLLVPSWTSSRPVMTYIGAL